MYAEGRKKIKYIRSCTTGFNIDSSEGAWTVAGTTTLSIVKLYSQYPSILSLLNSKDLALLYYAEVLHLGVIDRCTPTILKDHFYVRIKIPMPRTVTDFFFILKSLKNFMS